MKLAFLFPGQGAQSVGMGRALAESHDAARSTFAEADRVLGLRLSDLMWNGPDDALRDTANAQPALLTHSVAALRLLEAAGVRPQWAAGHSLGEYSACVAAGALTFADALRLTRRRGELMNEAGRSRPGTMAAILGLSVEQVEAVCAQASGDGVVRAANLNAPGQVVISGDVEAIGRAIELAKAAGARRAIRLEVGGAFHSPLMAPAAAGLTQALAAAEIRDARCAIVANVSGTEVREASAIRAALEAQLLGAVRWEASMRTLVQAGAEGFIEVGTGRVLRGLLRQIAPDALAYGVDDPDSLNATCAALGATAAGSAS